MANRPPLSIVVPMRNEASNVQALVARLVPQLDRQGGDGEIIAVDDGSDDATLERLREARVREPRLRIVSFSRNFGKEVALAAGLRYARGDAVVLMDADLQHPPELIERFVQLWRQGNSMVYAVRRDRRRESLVRRSAARAFYALFGLLSPTPLPQGGGDFRLLDRKVVDAINAMPERTRFTKGLYSWLGFRQAAVAYEVDDRHAGGTAWSFRALHAFAIDGIVSFSTLPLRVWSYLGAVISLLAIGYAGFILVRTLLFGSHLPGYPSLITAIMFFAGVQLLSLGIIGEYIGRIFTEVKRRPLYVVAEELGFDEAAGRVDEILPQRVARLAGGAIQPVPAGGPPREEAAAA